MFRERIAIIGFGYIGSVIGAVLADRGGCVAGYDPDKSLIDMVQNGKSPFSEPGLEALIKKNVLNGNLKVSTDVSITECCDVFIVTVGTPLSDDFTADMTYIENAITVIKPYIKPNALLILKSTVPPFTTEDTVAPLLSGIEGVKIAFCPERLAEGRAIEEFLSIPVIVGGIDDKSTKIAADFFREALPVDVIETSSATAAEMVKLADNLWIDLNIALAGELAQISDKMNIDVLEVIQAANSLPKGYSNVNILTPSIGVGGYCLTKDPWFVQHLGKQYGIELQLPKTGREVNDGMPRYSADIIDEIISGKNSDKSKIKVSIMGIAFKNNTGDCRYTPTKPAIDRLMELGYSVEICDTLTTDRDNKLVTTLPVSKNIDKTMKNADCVAFLTGHDDFRKIPISHIAKMANEHALIFDGRMFFKREQIDEINKYGLTYKGVGR